MLKSGHLHMSLAIAPAFPGFLPLNSLHTHSPNMPLIYIHFEKNIFIYLSIGGYGNLTINGLSP